MRWGAGLAILGVSVLAGLAATSGFGQVVSFLPRTAPTGRYGRVPTPPVQSAAGSPFPVEPTELPPWASNVLFSFVLGLAIVLAIWLIWRVLQLVQRGRRPMAKHATNQIALPVIDEAEVEEQLRVSIDQLRLGGSVDDAIIACWRRLEDLAADSGIERRPSQTSSEFTVDVLAQTRAEPADLTDLARLYRRAMFGRVAPDESARNEAIGCLQRLSAALTSPVAAGEAPAPDEARADA